MPSERPSRPYNWRPKSLAKLKLYYFKKNLKFAKNHQGGKHIDKAFAICPVTLKPRKLQSDSRGQVVNVRVT